MEQYQNAFNGIHASASFKRRMIGMMREMNERPVARAPRRETSGRIPAKRRALLIVIAAVLALLTACAAYAIYWSSTQRAKDDATARLELSPDQMQTEAEAYADADVNASTLTATLSGSATVGDVTIEMNAVDVFEDVDGAEYVFYYSLQSDSVGFVTSFDQDWLEDDVAAQERLAQYSTFCEIGMDARDFVLTIDGQAFQPYAQPDYEGVRQPASGWNEADGESIGTSSFMLRENPFPITQDTQMNLSGTLYACDQEGNRTGTIGSFSIDFAYEYPAEQAEAIRQEAIETYKQWQQTTNEARLESLNDLPTQATPIGLTQDALTLDDVTILDDGLLIGETLDYEWTSPDGTKSGSSGSNRIEFYLDGYQMPIEVMDMSWEQDKTQEPDEYGDYPTKSITTIVKIPYYRSADDMPEEILVYVTRNREQYDFDLQDVIITDYYEPLDMVFRVNRKTGAVTLPKDEDEKAAWIAEHNALASDGRNDARDYAIHQAQTINGMTLVLERLIYYPSSGTFQVVAFIPVIDCEVMPWELDPVVSIDGEELSAPQKDTYDQVVDPSTPEPFVTNIEEWVDTYGLDANRFCWYEYSYDAPARITEMPESFTLRFSWDVYDLGQNAEKTFIGTFAFETTITTDDYLVFREADDGYVMKWKRALMAEYNITN